MELGFAIPTPANNADWTYVKQFVTSVISQLDIGRQDNQTKVGVTTYRGLPTGHSCMYTTRVHTQLALNTNRCY